MDSLHSGLYDPLEFLSQTLAIYPHYKDQLDETLTSNLMASIPKHGFPLLSFSSTADTVEGGTECPTLLRFSSSQGLERLTCALLACPGARRALALTSTSLLAPADLARNGGFFELAEMLVVRQRGPTGFSHICDCIRHGARSQGPQGGTVAP